MKKSAFSQICSGTELEARTYLSSNKGGPKCCPTIITEAGVKKLLLGLDPTKAPGPDGISPRMLKEPTVEITPALILHYQSSLNIGVVPHDWRTANITPGFEKEKRYRPENYRPISLTSVPCTPKKHITVSAVMGHAESNNIIYKKQHGFQRGRSCESQLLGLVTRYPPLWREGNKLTS